MICNVSNRVQRSFDRSFNSYHGTASLQAYIAQCLVRRLRDLGAPQHFSNGFEVGCGTGHLTNALCQTTSFSRLILNDLTFAAHQTAERASAQFIQGDAREISWPKAPDLIVSASAIQWMDHPADFVQRVGQALAPGGWLAISGFGPAQFLELSELGSSANAPGLCAVDVLSSALRPMNIPGIEILEVRENLSTLWFESPQHVLRHLRETGVNGKASKVWTRSSLLQFCDEYVQKFGGPDGVPLTYNPTWIIARKTLTCV
ncbi:methyltransferase domain-containing protein [Cochlodiniinecator piscidefendens]|uniref:methyltransferase domain-containing protein n=1 Tax=Cochlodiniinecator piscidefendens TaxID=2715756 RepID=UPI00140D02B3|nr:methyltransferase domain-containing protein [Cochlodiniinecator piscidefendens]